MLQRPQRTVLLTVGSIGISGLLAAALWGIFTQNQQQSVVQTTVDIGTVTQMVTVSGTIREDTTGQIGVPHSGTLTELAVREGDRVTAGTVLARLQTTSVDSELRGARASLQEAIARQQELLAGPTAQTRDVIDTNVAIAEQQLARVTEEQNRLVSNARRALLSHGLIALADDSDARAPTPTVSGTYLCTETGSYQLEIYRSQTVSGFSARVTGLETTTIPISFTQSVPLGDCGLRITFSEDLYYNNTTWHIAIPNQNAAEYVTLQNAYETAQLTAENAISTANEAVTLAQQQRDRDTAPTRSEQLTQVRAQIDQIESQIEQLELRRADHTLTAPFSGTVTTVNAVVGELVGPASFITLLGDSERYELRTQIPEIDIAKIMLGQPAYLYFDAAPEDMQTGEISYISPLPTGVDGVAYFEARIDLDQQPDWLRTGLSADVDIEIKRHSDVTRLPASFIIRDGDQTAVRIKTDRGSSEQEISVPFFGTDGYAVVEGLSDGDVVVAP